MTGSEIQQKITDTKFFGPKANAFGREPILELDTPTSALEFLSLYCVLLSTTEYKDDDDKLYLDKLLKTYSHVKSILETTGQIATTEFLSDPPEELFFVLRKNTCFISE